MWQASGGGIPLTKAGVLTKRVNDHAVFGLPNDQSRTAIAGAGGRGSVQD
ncbi:hypothetical protein [Pseudomonas fluorescens]|nr:hypothetical protein [Pseudomonas fluorescens]